MKKEIARLQYVSRDDSNCSHSDQASLLCAAGLPWFQFRAKDREINAWVSEAMAVKKICAMYNTTFIVNDSVIVAAEVAADGVHLGQEDMKPNDARKILGNDAIIGGTANTLAQAIALVESGVDYIGLGPLRFTATKKNLSPILDFSGVVAVVEGLRKSGSKIPVVVIGGVVAADISRLKTIGVQGIAVSSALFSGKGQSFDATEKVKEFFAL